MSGLSRWSGAIALASMLLVSPGVMADDDRTLEVRPAFQETPVWCWVAVAEMVFRYYGVPNGNPVGNYQCGIVGGVKLALDGRGDCYANCANCIVPAGSAEYLRKVLELYPSLVNWHYSLNAYTRDYALRAKDVALNITNDRPVIAGINPSGTDTNFGGSQHVALIVGHKNDGKTLVINDPFPYSSVGLHPYEHAGGVMLRPGQWSISYDDFVEKLDWNESVILKPNMPSHRVN